MKKYYYCSVLPKGMKNTYYYIADEEVKVNAFVEFPFGYENTLVIGTVMEVGLFDEDNVPFPVERTKQILRTVSQEEFDNYPGFYAALHDDDDDDIEYELEEAEDYILCEDYDSIFDWAYEHHDRIESDRIMEMVCRCYEICVENGNPVAALNLGTLYYTGTYLERDYQKAAALYEIAAKAGERRAICNLGYCWYYGRHQAVDYERAYSYFHLAVLLYDDPNSLYKLGDMYRTGKFVEQNEIFAIKLYFRALNAIMREDEDKFCLADIQLRIGRAFLEGRQIEPDPERALHFLTDALAGFYARRKTDPFVKGLIIEAKELIAQAAVALDKEVI